MITEFNSNAQGLFYIFLMGFWIVFYYLALTMRGDNGKYIGFINIMQMVFSIVIGLTFAKFSFIIAFSSMFVGVGTFVGLILKNKTG